MQNFVPAVLQMYGIYTADQSKQECHLMYWSSSLYQCSLPVTDWPTNQLTKWRSILLVKLLIPQPIQIFPTYCGTTRFMTVFTAVHHLAIPSFGLIQAASACFCAVHFSTTLLSTPSLTIGFFPSGLLHQKPVCISYAPPYVPYTLPVLPGIWIWSRELYLERIF